MTGDILMDAEFIKWFATLGIGGVLAGFMFVFYRKDIKQYTDLWKLVSEQTVVVIKENTASISKLISLIESQEKNAIRRDDINQMIEERLTRQSKEIKEIKKTTNGI